MGVPLTSFASLSRSGRALRSYSLCEWARHYSFSPPALLTSVTAYHTVLSIAHFIWAALSAQRGSQPHPGADCPLASAHIRFDPSRSCGLQTHPISINLSSIISHHINQSSSATHL
ncbi:MAG: hypothetical protein N3D13_10680 [Thermaurantimonas aggregans]|uniref:hypothetical protein n=1 Tax=Thermaurantimonas aggregans TaxID=2173829 RepID=UPI000F5611FF|nr:hypothetical protein [Thermaurantimonas aggregans]MCX8149730.1 hypothetical protein [Thermaurantimonas aggregans]